MTPEEIERSIGDIQLRQQSLVRVAGELRTDVDALKNRTVLTSLKSAGAKVYAAATTKLGLAILASAVTFASMTFTVPGCKKTDPVPVAPVDKFAGDVKAAFVKDGKPVLQAAQLAGIYKSAALDLGSGHGAAVSVQDVFSVMHKNAGLLMPDTALPETRKFLKTTLDAKLGPTNKTLDAITRPAVIAELTRTSDALVEACK